MILDNIANELAKQTRLGFMSSQVSDSGWPELYPINLHRHKWRGYVKINNKEITIWDAEWQSYDPIVILLSDPSCIKKLKKEIWKRMNRSRYISPNLFMSRKSK